VLTATLNLLTQETIWRQPAVPIKDQGLDPQPFRDRLEAFRAS
jgi:hypothetical protein